MSDQNKTLVIVTPILDDWDCLKLLAGRIDTAMSNTGYSITLLVVNDGSLMPCTLDKSISSTFNSITSIEIIDLIRNMGHQRAIVTGLAWAHHEKKADYIVVMDGDGEDRPEDIPKLLETAIRNKDRIVFAQRAKRSEGIAFRIFYRIYKLLFRILTGASISYGNFCIIPSSLVKRVLHVSEIWNHFASGIINSRLPFVTMPAERGMRYCGRSRLKFTSLVLLGLSAIAVSLDRAAVRLIMASIGLICFSLLAILTIVAIRFYTDLAIPGWATYAVLSFSIIIVQGFTISAFLTFLVLSYRTQRHFIPYTDYSLFVLNHSVVA